MKSASTPGQASACIGEIIAAWSRGSAHTMEMAKVVLAARHRLRYGEWSKLWQSGRMPFSKRKGEMLVVIGERLGWIDAQSFAHLPVGWSVLYWLARLQRGILTRLVEEGVIHPKLTLREARELIAKIRGCSRHASAKASAVQRRLRGFGGYVERTLDAWSPTDREFARSELSRLIRQISGEVACRTTDIQFSDESRKAVHRSFPRNVITQPPINA